MQGSIDQNRDSTRQAGSAPRGSERESASGEVKKHRHYSVGGVESVTPPAPADITFEAAEEKRSRKVAVFVAHGMGQQIPFQTLDQVAEGLCDQDEAGSHRECKPEVRAVKFEEQLLQRIELQLKQGTAEEVETHIYEGYWAPLTEGKITARGVMEFLRGAASNGINNGSSTFWRWLFGRYREYDSPIRIVLYLLIALVTVFALVAMNSTIAVVTAARALLAGPPPAWLSNGLFADLTTTFNGVVTVMAAFGLSLAVPMVIWKKMPSGVRGIWGWLTIVLFIAALFAVVLGALSIALLFYGHVKLGTTGSQQLWGGIFSPAAVDAFNRAFDITALGLAILGGVVFVIIWLIKIVKGAIRDISHRKGRWITFLVTLCGLMLCGLAGWLGFRFMGLFEDLKRNGSLDVIGSGLAWPLLIAASAFIRQVLVQYVGDVAIYVAPYKVDGFYQLRTQIRDCVQNVARAVYAQQRADGSPEYDQIYVVGHSLGSVIAYDVLNRLINDDNATGGSMNVAGRTPLLMTFGSPLDKTAFLFALQRQHTSEAREALAATVQPLIQEYRFRPKQWINIYSPWDIISGSLGFYDPPGENDPRHVCNMVDTDASTLLAAHVEYWNKTLVFKTLYNAVCGDPIPCACERSRP